MTKPVRSGNATGRTLSPERLAEAGLEHGDKVSISVADRRIEIARAGGTGVESLELGRQFARRRTQLRYAPAYAVFTTRSWTATSVPPVPPG